MIGWLRGQVAEPWRAGHRCGLLLICGGIGYEVQLTLRQWARLPATGGDLTLHIHHSVREDGWTLFGFGDRQERDLFRDLVAVSGVGPQMALALLGAMEVDELVRAIAAADLRRLSQAPGRSNCAAKFRPGFPSCWRQTRAWGPIGRTTTRGKPWPRAAAPRWN